MKNKEKKSAKSWSLHEVFIGLILMLLLFFLVDICENGFEDAWEMLCLILPLLIIDLCMDSREKLKSGGSIVEPLDFNSYKKLWLWGGRFGLHRLKLCRFREFILKASLWAITLITICFNISHPESGLVWFSIICGVIVLLFWVEDYILRYYQCYVFNRNHYFINSTDENNILVEGKEGYEKEFYDKLEKEVPSLVAEISKFLEEAKMVKASTYIKKEEDLETLQGILNKASEAISTAVGDNSEHEFYFKKFSKMNDILNIILRRYKKIETYADRIQIDLEQARKNAYADISRAKELIAFCKKIQGQEQVLKFDEFTSIELDFKLELPDTEHIKYKVHARTDKMLNNASKVYDSITSGSTINTAYTFLKTAKNISKNIEAAKRECLEMAKGCEEIANEMEIISKNVVACEGEILRAKEILLSLNAAHIAFIKEYVKARNVVFKEDSTNWYYLLMKGEAFSQTEDFKETILQMARICSSYNKINKANIYDGGNV